VAHSFEYLSHPVWDGPKKLRIIIHLSKSHKIRQ